MTTRTDIEGRLAVGYGPKAGNWETSDQLEALYADLRFLLAELARVEAERDSVRLELQAERSTHRRDNEYLIGKESDVKTRFEDMARRVKEWQEAKRRLGETSSQWRQRAQEKEVAQIRLSVAEAALLALQTDPTE